MLGMWCTCAYLFVSASKVLLIDAPARIDTTVLMARLGEGTRVIRVPVEGESEPRQAQQDLVAANASLARGKKLAYEVDSGRAIAKFEEALAGFHRAAVAMTDFTPVAECLLHLGAAWLLEGREDRATTAFRQALALRSRAKLDPLVFNPDTVTFFRRIETAERRVPSGALTVNGQPEGATVAIDGHVEGELPLSIRNLPPGTHWLSVNKRGFSGFATQVLIPAGTAARQDVYLKPVDPLSRILSGLGNSQLSSDDLKALAATARDNAADAVVIVDSTPQLGRVWDNVNALLSAPMPVRLDAPQSWSELAAWVSPKAQPSSSAPTKVSVPAAPSRSQVSPWLALIPFGGGQFVEKRPVAGGLFAGSEIALLAINVIPAIMIATDRAADGTYFHAQRNASLQVVNQVAFTTLMAVLVYGAVDGMLHR
jgi:tetratricopeptide (TPR) repeat protein